MSYLLGISRLIQLILKLHKASGLKSAFLFYLIAQILVPPKDFSPIGSLEALYIYMYIFLLCVVSSSYYIWFLLFLLCIRFFMDFHGLHSVKSLLS